MASHHGSEHIDDPLERLERNERQGRLAFRFFLLSVVAVAVTAVTVIVLVGGLGEECEVADGLCLTAGRVEVVVIPTLLSLLLAVFSMWKTYQTWSRHIRWRPWLFATYAMWMLTTACLLFTSSIAFVEIG
jgi:ABC-type Na+ efflux pump permease subunit